MHMEDATIKRALISVYDKTGIVDFARALVDEFGIEIISTGGTASLLKENDIPVTLVEEVTGFPEMMDGRVKTLHPKIHAGILADRDNPEHMRQLDEQGIKAIDMVVVNLYPFEETVADPDSTFEQAVEMIDIGGPCLLRAAAKNNNHVLVVYHPQAYRETLNTLHSLEDHPDDLPELRARFAAGAFEVTACYDGEIATWIGTRAERYPHSWPWFEMIPLTNWGRLRYGENP
ncbi:MAG: bifunctional phosphoribosylaminoimidazolecarboxamide formyltransferase/IMP cyclohydrolase, partial [Phycisphaerae bacterium]